MRHVVTVCIAVTIIALTSVSAGRAHAEGGTDPVYAHLNAQQKHTYDQLYYGESDSENCYGIGRDGYNAYLAWANGTGSEAGARRGLSDTQRLCSYDGNAIAKLTKDPLFKTNSLYHAFVMDGHYLCTFRLLSSKTAFVG